MKYFGEKLFTSILINTVLNLEETMRWYGRVRVRCFTLTLWNENNKVICSSHHKVKVARGGRMDGSIQPWLMQEQGRTLKERRS